MHSATHFRYARHMGLSAQRLLDSLSRMPFIDSAELSRVLGEPHATVHRALTGLFADGIAVAAEWGAASSWVYTDMITCFPPVFDSASYVFSVPDDSEIGGGVGAVLATGSEGADDTVTYCINAGNEDGKLALDASTGQITVAEALSGLAGTTYTLTVEAVDESGDAATVTATVAVT